MDEIILKELIQSAKDRIDDLDQLMAGLRQLRSEISDVVDNSEQMSQYYDVRPGTIKELDDRYSKAITVADSIYHQFYKRNTLNGLLSVEEAEQNFITNIVSKTDQIDMFSVDGIGFLRMKMLPSLHKRTPFLNRGFSSFYNPCLGRGLDSVLCQRLNEQSFEVKCNRKILVYFLFIYPSSARRNCIPDSDNHDIKNVQDVIAHRLIGSDAHDVCATYYDTEISDLIPQGTYITVTDVDNRIPRSEEIIAQWQLHYSESPKAEALE